MVTLGVGEVIALAIAGATLLYTVAKDGYVSIRCKASDSKKLKENYEALEGELNFLLGFRTDIEQMIQRRCGRYTETYKRWNSRVKQIHEQTSSCLAAYEQIRKSSFSRRAKLSKRMVELNQKIVQLRGEREHLIRSINSNRAYGPPYQENNREYENDRGYRNTSIWVYMCVFVCGYMIGTYLGS